MRTVFPDDIQTSLAGQDGSGRDRGIEMRPCKGSCAYPCAILCLDLAPGPLVPPEHQSGVVRFRWTHYSRQRGPGRGSIRFRYCFRFFPHDSV